MSFCFMFQLLAGAWNATASLRENFSFLVTWYLPPLQRPVGSDRGLTSNSLTYFFKARGLLMREQAPLWNTSPYPKSITSMETNDSVPGNIFTPELAFLLRPKLWPLDLCPSLPPLLFSEIVFNPGQHDKHKGTVFWRRGQLPSLTWATRK